MTPGRNAVEMASIWSPYQAQQQRELLDADGRPSDPLPATDQPEEKE